MPLVKIHDTTAPSKACEADLIRRALTAWHKTGGSVPPEARPVAVTARLASKHHKSASSEPPHLLYFIVVCAGASVLAVYRVQQVQDYFMLRRMVRPPKDLVRLKE